MHCRSCPKCLQRKYFHVEHFQVEMGFRREKEITSYYSHVDNPYIYIKGELCRCATSLEKTIIYNLSKKKRKEKV